MKNAVVEMMMPKGEPNGLKIVKLAGWIGKAFVVPRKDISEIKEYNEASLPAVYFLFSEVEEDKPLVYIGQTDNLWRRLNQQNTYKENWNVALIFTGQKDIDTRYLEDKAIEEATLAERYELDNKVVSPGSVLSDFAKASNDNFFDNMKFVVSLLGYSLFTPLIKEENVHEFYYLEDQKNKDAKGKGTLLDTGEFLVFKGSTARIKETESFLKRKHGVNLRRKLLEIGVFEELSDKTAYVFTKDYNFATPSAAADTVMARSSNGWTSWKDKDGKTLDELKR